MDEPKDKNSLSKEDLELWESHVRDMADLPESEKEDFETLLEGQEIEDIEKELPPFEKKKIVSQPPSLKDKKNSEPAQLDKRTAEKLRKGQFPIEARLDLHGLNKTQAHEKLVRFITSCYAQELRCVLVITGKGISNSTSEDWLVPSKGVLKENVPYWLSEAPLNEIILKHVFAQPKDGGSGALYVYLKRNR